MVVSREKSRGSNQDVRALHDSPRDGVSSITGACDPTGIIGSCRSGEDRPLEDVIDPAKARWRVASAGNSAVVNTSFIPP